MHKIISRRNLTMLSLLLFTGTLFADDHPPEWTQGAVWYHVLTERFRNINPRNDPGRDDIVDAKVEDWQVHPWASDWYKLQVWEKGRDASFQELVRERRYGGNLIGVIEKLPYLKNFGVNVLYLTPIFESPSVEKYDAATLHHVDNNFGFDAKEDLEKIATEREDSSSWSMTKGDEVFLELLNQAHELKMKVVIEAVFNYCSTRFWAFRDLREKQENSTYKDWFQVLSWDDPATPDTVEFSYKCWQNDPRYPSFKTTESGDLSAPVKQYVMSITRRWMDMNGDGQTRDGVDGWSVKHVSALPDIFWRDWNVFVKAINVDAVTISDLEVDHIRMQQQRFDLIRGRSVSDIFKNFFVSGLHKTTLSDFIGMLKAAEEVESDAHRNSRLILLDDQSTFRIASQIVNAEPKSMNGHSTDNGYHASYNPVCPDSTQRSKQALVTLFQLTYPGAPIIFYGDESGMWGGSYPDNIKPMLWREFIYEKESYSTVRPDIEAKCANDFNPAAFLFYRRMNLIREDNEALVRGEFRTHIVDDQENILVYSRKHRTNEVYVLMNLSDEKKEIRWKPGWKKGLKVKEPLRQTKYKLDKYEIKLEVEPLSARVLVKEK